MDLHWRVARMRGWIEQGEREGLTFRALAERTGASERTLRRWSAAFREERRRTPASFHGEHIGPESSNDSSATQAGRPPTEDRFVEFDEPAAAQVGQIQIVLPRGRRVVIDRDVDVEALVRVITAVERC